MNLIIDIGNSRVKAAVFSAKTSIFHTDFPEINMEIIDNILNRYPIENAIISSVATEPTQFGIYLNKKKISVLIADKHTPLPVRNFYKSRETLGFDRLAAAVGAYTIYPGNDVLIFDAGTAITIDFISASGEFAGGNISPGIEMRFKALHSLTDRLPLVNPAGEISLTGKTTEEAIRNGVINGVVFEVDGYIDRYRENYPSLKAILTGGDTNYFDKRLKNSIFVDSILNLKGLNEILDYNTP